MFDTLAHKSFLWFQDNCHPETGMVKDRSSNFEGGGTENRMSSIASTGYHLSLLPYAVQRGWIQADYAQKHTMRTLRFVKDHLEHHYGLLYHFIDWETGQRWNKSEFSLLDTAIFLNGCMVVSEALDGIAALADSLLDRVDWNQYLIHHPTSKKLLLSFGWSPDDGGKLLYPADVRSSELAMPYFIAAGSRTYPIDPQVWYNTAVVIGDICGYQILNPSHALFTSYYGMGWVDLRGMVDLQRIDLYDNARQAALANRTFCYSIAASHSTTYGDSEGGWWGISAGDSPAGYVARGPIEGDPDGTVWPMAALASLIWIPDVLEKDLSRWVKSDVWSRVFGKYGLSPFSLDRQWVAEDVIGIDLGSYAISWANYRQRAIWEFWMRHPIAKNAIKRLEYLRHIR